MKKNRLDLDTDFVVLGNCIGRPRGWRRVLVDAICRLTGHLLWRNVHSAYRPVNGSLPVYTSWCRRCFTLGYLEGDYRPIEPEKPALRLNFDAAPLCDALSVAEGLIRRLEIALAQVPRGTC